MTLLAPGASPILPLTQDPVPATKAVTSCPGEALGHCLQHCHSRVLPVCGPCWPRLIQLPGISAWPYSILDPMAMPGHPRLGLTLVPLIVLDRETHLKVKILSSLRLLLPPRRCPKPGIVAATLASLSLAGRNGLCLSVLALLPGEPLTLSAPGQGNHRPWPSWCPDQLWVWALLHL